MRFYFFRKICVLFVVSVFFSGCAFLPYKSRHLTPRIAFVIDDAGYHTSYKNYVRKINAPVTYAVIPFTDCSKYMAKYLNKQGAEVILHMPMAAKSNLHNKEKYMLFPGMDKNTIRKNIEHCLDDVPYVVGVNNHKGSSFTNDYEGIYEALKVIKEKNLFFLDSLTVRESKASLAADKLDMRIGVRDVFLDNKKEINYIKKQIASLVRVAKSTGKGIGIGHYNKVTLQAIYESIPSIRAQGVEIVFVSELI